MSLTPRMAPPYDTAGMREGGNGRVQRYGADHSRPLSRASASTYRPRTTRRRRSRSREHCRTSNRQRKNRRNVKLVGVVLVIALSGAILHSFGHRKHEVGGGDGGEEARLRREVEGLEHTLRRKKELLVGVTPGLLPGEIWSAGRGGGGGGGGGVRYGGGGDMSWKHATPVELEQVQVESSGNEYRTRPPVPEPPALDESPPIPRVSLAGEALFGSTPPLRPSLESQPSLIREPVPLIVGGTDGSGTRGVVDLLQRLKVPMIVEDKGTMDVHGAPYMVKGGWPMVARPVIEWARGTGYEPRAAPAQLRRKTFEALDNLREKMQQSARTLRSPRGGEAAKHVSWGFKAPVSMVLVPFFEEAWGKGKFLHVVRDGRDIAFSGNQTPVDKFYADTFPKGSRELRLREPSLKAIALWDRWNVGVYEWAAGRKESGASSGMDYLLLHAEDLIDPAAKFAAIKDVAEFVGSPLSDAELCCIATEGSRDMGSHTTSRKDRGKVTARFGKWKGKVDGDPQLSRLLHDEGERGLRLFGYEPERSLRASGGFQCAEERDQTCPKAPIAPSHPRQKQVRPDVEVPAHVSVDDTAACFGLKKNVDFKGFDLKAGYFDDHLGCCQECRQVRDCSFFTFDYNAGLCYLKTGKGAENSKLGLVSGVAQQAAMS